MKTIDINVPHELIDKIIEAKVKMEEQGILDIVFNSSKENIEYISEYYMGHYGYRHIHGVYGMKINVINLPKDITFILTEDEDMKTIRVLKNKISELREKLGKIEDLL